MIGFLGSHFVVLVLAAFGIFACVLGYLSIADAVAHRNKQNQSSGPTIG